MKKASIILFACILSFLLAWGVYAQKEPRVYIDGTASVIRLGEYAEARILFDPGSENINAFHIDISYSDGVILESIKNASSIVGIWIQKDIDKEKKIARLEGMIPGGFAGTLVPHTIQRQPGHIATLLFRAVKEGNIKITPERVEFFAHDGTGRNISVRSDSCTMFVGGVEEKKEPKDCFGNICTDVIPPQPFSIFIVHTPDIFDGNAGIMFEARDGESGISHYIVRESIRSLIVPFPTKTKHVERGPIALSYQRAPSVVEVTAIDFGGNEYTQRIYYPEMQIWWYEYQDIGILIAIGICGLLYMLLHRKEKRRV